MNGKGFQLNGRKVISLLLALLILALVAAPALAWAPEDEAPEFSRSPQYQRMAQINAGQGSSTQGTSMRPGHKHAARVSRFRYVPVAAVASPGRVMPPGDG